MDSLPYRKRAKRSLLGSKAIVKDAMHILKGLIVYRLDERFNKLDASALSTGAIVAPGVHK
eukprot:scaffold479881_cov18-Prasinocladus_malaysianus.AAC.1